MRKTLFSGALAVGVLVLLHSSARAVDPDTIKRAVDSGVAYLKQNQNQDGSWGANNGHTSGCTALAAMTLLECGVGADEAGIKKAAEVVRSASVSLGDTYEIALAILFLDKLRDPVDVALIESLTVRLMAGQNAQGGWSYKCPPIGDAETQRLLGLLKNRNELVGKRELPKGDDTKRTPKDLPKEIQDQIGVINRGLVGQAVVRNDMVGGGNGDNSNTQFATLALWVARRHGLPVDKALGRVNVHFRTSVNADGGWSYSHMARNGPALPGAPGSTASMTCAGLLGLAVAYGVVGEIADEKEKAKEPEKNKDKDAKPKDAGLPDITKDAVLTRGITALSTTVGVPAEKLQAMGKPAAIPQIGGQSYYFLWSLERVCMAMDLDTIGGKDWYNWGAEILIANQTNDGSWQGEYANYKADTCFALLFLKRANFARDLSARLKGKLDQKALRGGVGAEGLKEKLGGGLTKPGEGAVEQKPTAETKESERLAREVVEAKGERQEQLLAQLRDG
jgi:hypothetical protein